MTRPALYRYFDCRDALFTALAIDELHDFADAVEAAARAAASRWARTG